MFQKLIFYTQNSNNLWY